jgi:hypothetical protein
MCIIVIEVSQQEQQSAAGKLGGKASWAKLTPEERRKQAQKMARARWGKMSKKQRREQARSRWQLMKKAPQRQAA